MFLNYGVLGWGEPALRYVKYRVQVPDEPLRVLDPKRFKGPINHFALSTRKGLTRCFRIYFQAASSAVNRSIFLWSHTFPPFHTCLLFQNPNPSLPLR